MKDGLWARLTKTVQTTLMIYYMVSVLGAGDFSTADHEME
jgi:hypothetical protein